MNECKKPAMTLLNTWMWTVVFHTALIYTLDVITCF